MHRRQLLSTIASTGAIVALAGCTTSEKSDEVTVENMNVEETKQNTIRVTGNGVVKTDPNKVNLSVSIEVEEETATEVTNKLQEKSSKLLSALSDYGLSDQQITTSQYSIHKSNRYDHYTGRHGFSIELFNTDNAGEIIDLAAKNGATNLGNVQFTVTEERREELYDKAVQKAVEDARKEAELYVEASGKTLGEPVSIEATDTGHQPFMPKVTYAGDTEGTQLEQGLAKVTATVEIEYKFS